MNFENNVYDFIKNLNHFEYTLEYKDRIWKIIFPDKKLKCHYMVVTKYNEVYYISDVDGKSCTLEVVPKKSVAATQSFGRTQPAQDDPDREWGDLIIYANKWLTTVKKDWIKANKYIQENYPDNRRYGIVPNAIIRESLTDIYRIDKKLGKVKTKKFLQLVESGYFENDKNTTRTSMTANDFFEYCKIAYIAAQEKNHEIEKELSGREMYKRYADGRDEGLTEIALNSKQDFADWLDKKHEKRSTGGHPWEIKRGGNTTHIDLYVTRPSFYKEEGFVVTLNGPSIGRLKETIEMFLAIQAAGLPITLANHKSVYKRLLAQDNIGIVPCFDSLHRANQRFHEHEEVFDVLHFDDLGKYKRRIRPFITWEPLPILKPNAI